MIVGGSFLCFEGCEKLAHKFLHSRVEDETHHIQHVEIPATTEIDVVAAEKEKIRGAVRTDFILSAEIIVITLDIVESAPFITRLMVLVGVGVLMTVGVYGLVAAIVKIDDLGAYLAKEKGAREKIGRFLLASAPYLMKFLTIAGTAAMFFVGGGILVHKIGPIDHQVEYLVHLAADVPVAGFVLKTITKLLLDGSVGIIAGALVLMVVTSIKWMVRSSKK